MSIVNLQNCDTLRDFLVEDRFASAYLLGYLDPAYFQWCKVYGWEDDSKELQALVMLYSGLSLPVVMSAGDAKECERLVGDLRSTLPSRFQFHLPEDQVRQLEDRFKISDKKKMLRMGVSKSDFKDVETNASVVRQLGHRDTAAIIDIYQHYPDHLFEAYQLETGYYYGVPDDDGSLKSIAGIHVYSEENDIALVGNFVTRPDARGNGFATACAAKLFKALLKKVNHVALNVPAEDDGTRRLFEKFGLHTNNEFVEGSVTT